MDRLQSMQVFTKVVELNSFTRAADALLLPRSTVSLIVRKLEAHLRIRLMQRTTRTLHLTPEGDEYFRHCLRILAEIEETEDALANAGEGPRGRLRVEMPAAIGRGIVMPGIRDFCERFPGISLAIGLGDHPVDLIQDGVDCAIRVGEPQDSTLIRRSLGVIRMLTAASPEYLDRHGEPRAIDQLDAHRAVQHWSSDTDQASAFTFDVDGATVAIPVRATLSFSEFEAIVVCGVDSVGLIQAPHCMLAPYLASGALVEVLSHWRPRPLPISALYPRSRHLALRLGVFVDWLAARLERSADAGAPRAGHREARSVIAPGACVPAGGSTPISQDH
jgi:LysR family transcriptional regulator for bpeEF and oprC